MSFIDIISEQSSDQTMKRLSIIDYGVFAFMLIISAVIGIYYGFCGKKQSTTSEFLMGSRSMSTIPVAMSVMASFISAIALLGIPAEVYIYGLQNWAMVWTFPLVMILSSYLFMPVFYDLKVTSTYEYLDKRFGKSVRLLGSVTFAINMMFYMAVVLYAPALALSQVTGLSVWFSVLSTGLVCTFYTTIGGMKAVVWTDVFQTLLMFIMMFTVVIKGVIDLGGLESVWNINKKYQRIELLNLNPDPLVRHTLWTITIGSIVHWTSIYGTNQTMVQRYLSIPTLKKAQKTLLIVLPLKTTIITISCLAGLVVFAKYHDCDPMSTNRVKSADQLFPLFVVETLGFIPGFVGLFVAGVFSGSLSSISSGVNSLAAITLQDFIKPFIGYNLSESSATIIVKFTAVLYGLLSIALVLVAQHLGNILQAAIAIFGLIGSPVFGLFVLGMFIPSTNSKGAFWGTILGIFSSLWIGIGAMIYKPYLPRKPISVESCIDLYQNLTSLNYTSISFGEPSIEELNKNSVIPVIYQLSYQYYGVIGALVTVIAGYLISVITGRTSIADVDSKLFTPFVRKRVEKLQKMKINSYVEKFGREKINAIIAKALAENEIQILSNGNPNIVKNIVNEIIVENNNQYTNEGFVKSDETKF